MMTTENNEKNNENAERLSDSEIEEAVSNTIKASDKVAEVRVSIGAEAYNVFTKCGGKMKPADFKEFERQLIKYFYGLAGADVGDALCNFECFVQSYLEMLQIVWAVQSENKVLQNRLEAKRNRENKELEKESEEEEGNAGRDENADRG